MHKPPHRYSLAHRPGITLPEHSRWSCILPQNGDGHPWCGVKHTAERHAARHCETLNKGVPQGQPRHSPAPIFRIERYSSTELHYRGWTEDMIRAILGEADAEDSGDKHVYEPRLYDVPRVHHAELTPRFDHMSSQAQRANEATTFEEDFTAILRAVSRDVHLAIPSVNPRTLIEYARADLQRMSDEKAARENGLSVKRDIGRIRTLNGARYLNHPEGEALAHAAQRCAPRSKPASAFFRQHRQHHMGHEAWRILTARLGSAVCEIAPDLRQQLTPIITNPNTRVPYLDQLPQPGQPLPWSPAHRVNYRDEAPLPQKFHNLTNLRWARFRNGPPEAPGMPPWGVVTITTEDDSLEGPFRWRPTVATPTATPPGPKPAAPTTTPAPTAPRLF